jgi:hypothetical protein
MSDAFAGWRESVAIMPKNDAPGLIFDVENRSFTAKMRPVAVLSLPAAVLRSLQHSSAGAD